MQFTKHMFLINIFFKFLIKTVVFDFIKMFFFTFKKILGIKIIKLQRYQKGKNIQGSISYTSKIKNLILFLVYSPTLI